MYKGRRVPEGRMIRGECEIALTTPVSLPAFQPSFWDGSSLLRFQAFHALTPEEPSLANDKCFTESPAD
jgi:hypothetical protein